MKATKIRKCTWGKDVYLYMVDPPVKYGYEPVLETPYLVASAAIGGGLAGEAEEEVYLFPCDAAGDVLSWSELNGSQRGTLDHDLVLTEAGYKVVV